MKLRLFLPLVAVALLAGCTTPAEGVAGARARAINEARSNR